MKKANRRAKATGSIFTKNGYYVAQVQDGYRENGLPRYRQAQRKTHAEAAKALLELQAKVTCGTAIMDGRAPNLGDWLDTWLQDHILPNHAPKTYDFYKLNVKRSQPYFGKTDIRKVKPQDINQLFAKLKAKGATPNTIDATRRTLRAAFGVAVKMGICSENPVSKTFAPKVSRPERPFLDEDQAKRLLEALKGSPIENLVRFTLATALRVGEATGLAWQDLDLSREKEQFIVRNQLQRVGGKLTLCPLKTVKSRRTLPLIMDSLRVVKSEQARKAIEGFENELGLVFLNPYGRPFDPKYVDEKLKEALAKAGVPPMGMHALRHSAATFMLMGGMNLHLVSRFLGHSQIALTVNQYGHALDSGMREAAEAMQRAYGAD